MGLKVTDRVGGHSNGKVRFLVARLGGSRHPHKQIDVGPLSEKGQTYRGCITDDFDPAVHKYRVGVKALSSDSAYMENVMFVVKPLKSKPILVADLKYKGLTAFKVDTDGGMNVEKGCNHGKPCALEMGENKI